MMNANDYAALTVPADTTLGTLKGFFLNGSLAAELCSQSGNGQVRIRFLRRIIGTDQEAECDDAMTIGEFRRLAAKHVAWISVDDGSGGQRVMEPA